ncbi:MAG TPA: DUF2891 family protein, partial [Bacteroidia bacterium]|nr:DUF2891 family protein [Bacteroidia bacterium]
MKIISIFLLSSFIALHIFAQSLTEEQAIRLARLPLHCIVTEYPNKTAHVINNMDEALLLPSQLHPTFYGCLDWHSSVHGHWMLVKILKQFPTIAIR